MQDKETDLNYAAACQPRPVGPESEWTSSYPEESHTLSVTTRDWLRPGQGGVGGGATKCDRIRGSNKGERDVFW